MPAFIKADNRAVRASDHEVGIRSGADRAAGGCTHIARRQRRPAQRGEPGCLRAVFATCFLRHP